MHRLAPVCAAQLEGGHVPQCPNAGDATGRHEYRRLYEIYMYTISAITRCTLIISIGIMVQTITATTRCTLLQLLRDIHVHYYEM